jgi:glycosyltransferase involved in cell wall biosynthesis
LTATDILKKLKSLIIKKNPQTLELDTTDLPAWFEPTLYLELNPDINIIGIDPTQHYLEHGRHEAWRICTLPLSELPDDFDQNLYLELNPDIIASNINPTIHYLLYGRHEPWRTCSLPLSELPKDFDQNLYLELNPDVLASNINPTAHYLLYGRHEAWRTCTLPLSELPDSFDPELYLKINPDIMSANINPTAHYLLHGRHETGRTCLFPKIKTSLAYQYNSNVNTILMVSHEASRSGAPILTLNISQQLSRNYNIVVLLLGDGPLTDSFLQAGAAVISAHSLKETPDFCTLVIDQLCKSYNFKFAIVNSIESRLVTPALANKFIPTVSLIHEFAACYKRPYDVFKIAALWSTELVFSAKLTLESAISEYPELSKRHSHILPQGRSILPKGDLSDKQLQHEEQNLRESIRPHGSAGDLIVVLGAGYVNFRKGVDIFIECAARVLRSADGKKFRFVWIGQGYDPINDAGYSVYLADQIRRCNIQDHVIFLEETALIETVYTEANLLLLSSRLDPLPNVAIDAMEHKIPVLCFDKTTGIADFLISSQLQKYCVADYLDTVDMANKILTLGNSQELRTQVADICHKASTVYFNMHQYVAQIETLAQQACERSQQEHTDTLEILNSGLFQREDVNIKNSENISIEEHVRAYVRGWASHVDCQRPHSEFNPELYIAHHGLENSNADPLADYLRAGRPSGVWDQ